MQRQTQQQNPANDYAVAEASEWVTTTRGGYLELILKVVRGPSKGLRFIDRLHLQNPDLALQEQAYKRLSEYCHVTGQIQINDSSQLHGIPFWVKLNEVGSRLIARLQDEQDDGSFTTRGDDFRVEPLG